MKVRTLTAKTLFLAFGKILAAFAVIGITAILTRLLTKQEYATHKQALMIYAMLAPALGLGLPKALYYFLPGEHKRPRAILLENLLVLGILGAAFAAFMMFGGGVFFAQHFENAQLAELAPVVALYGVCMVPMAALGPTMMARDRVGTLVWFQIGGQASLILMVAISAYLWTTPSATISAYACWSFGACVLALTLMLRSTALSAEYRPTFGGMKSQLAYGIPLGLAGMFGGLSAQIDKYMVSVMCTTEDFAIYVTGAVELPLIGVVTGAMNAVVLPELAKSYKAGNLQYIRRLWQRAMNKAILVIAPAMFVVLLFGSELIVFLFSASYEAAAEPFKVYALSLPLRAAVYGSVLMATNRTRWVTISAIIGLAMNALLNWVFVNWMGYTGAAWASVITTYGVVLTMLVPMCFALKTTLAELFDWAHLGKVALATVGPALAVYLCLPLLPWAGVVKLFGGTAVYGVGVLGAYRAFGIGTLSDIAAFLKRQKTDG